MLTKDQVSQFELFGFVVLKDIFDDSDLKVLRDEFSIAVARHENEVGLFNGEEDHTFSMMGEDTPFYSSLLEDPRFYEPASQLFGEDIIALEVNSYRYTGNTPWHYNDGSPNRYGYGPKYQFPIFEPVTGETGALRMIPGSHRDPWQSDLTKWWPLAKGSSRSDVGIEYLDKIPHYAAECNFGDAVLFDMRIVHSTFGGAVDRKVTAVTYYNYPETAEELHVMKSIAPGFVKNPQRWNKVQWEEWFSNPNSSSLRQSWIDSWELLATNSAQKGIVSHDGPKKMGRM